MPRLVHSRRLTLARTPCAPTQETGRPRPHRFRILRGQLAPPDGRGCAAAFAARTLHQGGDKGAAAAAAMLWFACSRPDSCVRNPPLSFRATDSGDHVTPSPIEAQSLLENQVALRFIGDRERLPVRDAPTAESTDSSPHTTRCTSMQAAAFLADPAGVPSSVDAGGGGGDRTVHLPDPNGRAQLQRQARPALHAEMRRCLHSASALSPA